MLKNKFKFFNKNIQKKQLIFTTSGNYEYCFQFDNGDPVVFASGSNRLTINLEAPSDILFYDTNGRTLKLFSRNIENE